MSTDINSNSIIINTAIFLDKIKKIAEQLLEHKFDNVMLVIARPPTGTIGCHNYQYLCSVDSNKKYSFIHLHPGLFKHEHKATLFGVIIHEFIHEKQENEFLSINKKYQPHGESFRKMFKEIGVTVNDDGLMDTVEKTGKFYLSYESNFKELKLPFTYNMETPESEENILIQGTAYCPSCNLEVITLSSKDLICKECYTELNNNYKQLLTKELDKREKLYTEYLYDFSALCVYYPLQIAKKIAYVREALKLTDKTRLEKLSYHGQIDDDGKSKLYKAAYNLIISHKNIAKIKELLNV